MNSKHWVKFVDEQRRDALHAVRHVGEAARDRAAMVLKPWFQRTRRQVRAADRRRAQLAERWGFYRTEWSIERELEKIAVSGRVIVAGPWLSEVGFETLYWLPFLHWFRAAFRVPAERLVAVSRGGTESWYAGIATRYVEIWDDLDPEEFARRNAARTATKQYELSELDGDVLKSVARRLGTEDFEVLHPGLMYRLFTLYWSGQRAMGFVDAHTRFTRVAPPSIVDPALLPHDYIAVKFYGARSLPATPEMRTHLRGLVAAMSERLPVVLLDTGLVLDEHTDYDLRGRTDGTAKAVPYDSAKAVPYGSAKAVPYGSGGRVISARDWMTPRNNLGVQTQIIAGARAFIGTCGSLAWLAPRLGVDTSAFYVDPKWLHAHLAVAMRAYHKLDAGRFAVADLRALEPVGVPALCAPAT